MDPGLRTRVMITVDSSTDGRSRHGAETSAPGDDSDGDRDRGQPLRRGDDAPR